MLSFQNFELIAGRHQGAEIGMPIYELVINAIGSFLKIDGIDPNPPTKVYDKEKPLRRGPFRQLRTNLVGESLEASLRAVTGQNFSLQRISAIKISRLFPLNR